MEIKELTLVEHLEELRKRIIICLIALAIATLFVFPFRSTILKILRIPAGNSIKQLAFFSPAEALVAYIKIALFSALIISLPVILYELWLFISPALEEKARRYTLGFVGSTLVSFLGGVCFSYFVLLPMSLEFLLGFAGDDLIAIISVGKYISFVLGISLACGLVFEMPVVSFILSKLGLINAKLLRRKRKYALVIILIVAGIVTPTPDVFNMLLLALPMLALYEVSIWVSNLVK